MYLLAHPIFPSHETDRLPTAVNYRASLIVSKQSSDSTEGNNGASMTDGLACRALSKPERATKINIGKRMPSFKILSQADARPWHLQELLKSNGRWRVVVFPGRLTEPDNMQRFQQLGKQLGDPESFIQRYTPRGQSIDSVIEVLTVHAGPRREVELLDLPEAFHPYDSNMGWDYWKVYVDDNSYHEGHGRAYEHYGINPTHGASVIIRPDQHVSWVGDMDDYENISRFFSGFMKPQQAE